MSTQLSTRRSTTPIRSDERAGAPTKAAYHTHYGTLVVQLSSLRDHQLSEGQAVQLTGPIRADSARLPSSDARRYVPLPAARTALRRSRVRGTPTTPVPPATNSGSPPSGPPPRAGSSPRGPACGPQSQPVGYGHMRPAAVGGTRRVNVLTRK